MCFTCDNVERMSKMIQIRNVPDDVHREAKVRAARAGMTLSAYLLRQIKRALEVPDIEDLMERIGSLERIRTTETAAEIIRAERDAR